MPRSKAVPSLPTQTEPVVLASLCQALGCVQILYSFMQWLVRESVNVFGGLVVSMLASGNPSSRVQTRPNSSDFSGIWKILRMPSFGGEVKESVQCPSFAACKRTYYFRELRCARKIPCIVPSFASRGLSCLCGAWRLWRWMRGTHWGKGTIGLQAAVPKRSHTRQKK